MAEASLGVYREEWEKAQLAAQAAAQSQHNAAVNQLERMVRDEQSCVQALEEKLANYHVLDQQLADQGWALHERHENVCNELSLEVTSLQEKYDQHLLDWNAQIMEAKSATAAAEAEIIHLKQDWLLLSKAREVDGIVLARSLHDIESQLRDTTAIMERLSAEHAIQATAHTRGLEEELMELRSREDAASSALEQHLHASNGLQERLAAERERADQAEGLAASAQQELVRHKMELENARKQEYATSEKLFRASEEEIRLRELLASSEARAKDGKATEDRLRNELEQAHRMLDAASERLAAREQELRLVRESLMAAQKVTEEASRNEIEYIRKGETLKSALRELQLEHTARDAALATALADIEGEWTKADQQLVASRNAAEAQVSSLQHWLRASDEQVERLREELVKVESSFEMRLADALAKVRAGHEEALANQRLQLMQESRHRRNELQAELRQLRTPNGRPFMSPSGTSLLTPPRSPAEQADGRMPGSLLLSK